MPKNIYYIDSLGSDWSWGVASYKGLEILAYLTSFYKFYAIFIVIDGSRISIYEDIQVNTFWFYFNKSIYVSLSLGDIFQLMNVLMLLLLLKINSCSSGWLAFSTFRNCYTLFNSLIFCIFWILTETQQPSTSIRRPLRLRKYNKYLLFWKARINISSGPNFVNLILVQKVMDFLVGEILKFWTFY